MGDASFQLCNELGTGIKGTAWGILSMALWQCWMVTDGNHTSGEHCMTQRDAESLCRTPETHGTLCVSCTQKN